MRIAPYIVGALIALNGCGPHSEAAHRLGDLGCYCKPDGTCNSPNLECREAPLLLGIPVDAASCHLKAKP